MEKDRIHWGIIGCGNVTEKKSGPAFYTLPNTTLTAVMRRDAVKAADYARRHGINKWYDNADDLINDPDVEAVYIATPPDSHAMLTIKALEKQKPVYVEKPMALTYTQCMEMIQASQTYKTPLFVAYYRREQPYFLKVKELLESGAIGDAKHVTLRFVHEPLDADYNAVKPWRLDYKQSGGGYFPDMGSHQLDILMFLFGAVENVQSIVLNKGGIYDVEDYVSALFQFRSGISLQALWYFTAAKGMHEDSVEIIGSKGSLLFSVFDMFPIVVKTDQEVRYDIGKPQIVEAPMISRISDALLSGSYNASPTWEAAEVTRLIEQILTPYYARKTL